MTETMTSRDRFLATLSGRPVDRPFVWESGFWETAVERWRGEGLPADADPYEYLGLERIACVWITFEPDPPFHEHVVGKEDGWLLIETEAGELIRRHSNMAFPRQLDAMEDHIERFPIRDWSSWQFMRERLRPDSPARIQSFEGFLGGRKDTPLLNRGLSGSFDPADGLATAFQVMMPTYWIVRKAGFLKTCTLLYDDPALVDEIFRTFTDFLTAQLEPVLNDRAPDIVFLNEGAAASKHGPIMSPEMYSRYAVPALSRLAQMFRDAGSHLVYAHSGGNVLPLVETWTELGINGLIPVNASIDLDTITRRFPEFGLIGGIHRAMIQADPKALVQHVFDQAALLYANRRAIPSGDVYRAVTSSVSLQNMQLYVKTLKDAGLRFRM